VYVICIVFRYEEVLDISVPKPRTLQIHTSASYIILGTHRVSLLTGQNNNMQKILIA